MFEAFCRFISVHRLLSTGSRMLVAVSGGLDSMTLLHLLGRINADFGVAHINHGLRGKESDAEEAFVQEWCRKQSRPLYIGRVEAKSYADEQGISIQMAARELRYDRLHQTAEQHDYSLIATAHHQDDQAETLVAQFLRGNADLGGIPVRNGKVIRPLLFARRELIRSYAHEHGIIWCEDSSNSGDAYERNRIRHHLIPALQQFNPSFSEATGRFAFRALGASEIYSAGLALIRAELLQPDGPDGYRILLPSLMKFENPASVLHCLIKDYGFSIRACEDLIAGMERQPGRVFIGNGYRIIYDRGALLLRKMSDHQYDLEVVQVNEPGNYCLGNQELQCTVSQNLSVEGSASVAAVDLDLLKFPLVWRRWQPGDVFVPLGMEGHQKVSDFLINRKISRPEKENVSVLLSDGKIIWVAGLRISQIFRVTGRTKAVLRLVISRIE